MQLALAGRSLGAAHPLEEDIRIAAITGYPWLVIDHEKYMNFLQQPELDIRDLKRLFLRTQPAAIDRLRLPDCAPKHLDAVEMLAKEARRVGAAVIVLRITEPDERVVAFAEMAQRWSTVIALAPTRETGGATFERVRQVVLDANHDALGWYLDVVALWANGIATQPDDAARTVLLAVGDQSAAGDPVLPGSGVVPLVEMLQPLMAGGYNGLAVLSLEDADTAIDAEAFAGAGRRALAEVIAQAGWTLDE